jgi:hypothetical protein
MGMNKIDLMDELQNRRTSWLFDDFHSYTDTQLWTKTLTGSATAPTVTNPAASNGVISLGNVADQINASAIVATTLKNWTFAANRPMFAEASIQYTEAATNNAAIFFGFASAMGATFLANTTSVPIVTGSAAGIYKLFGETVWRALLNVNGVQVLSGLTIESSQPSATTTFQTLRVQVDIVGTNVEATFFVGQRDTPGGDASYPVGLTQLREAASGLARPVKLRLAYASSAAMSVSAKVKQLTAAPETLVVDYMAVGNLRT